MDRLGNTEESFVTCLRTSSREASRVPAVQVSCRSADYPDCGIDSSEAAEQLIATGYVWGRIWLADKQAPSFIV